MQAKTGLHALSTERECSKKRRHWDNDPSFLGLGHGMPCPYGGPMPRRAGRAAANQTVGGRYLTVHCVGDVPCHLDSCISWVELWSRHGRLASWQDGGPWAQCFGDPGWAPPLGPQTPRQAPHYCLLRYRTDLIQGQTRAFDFFVIRRPFLFRAPCRPVPPFLPSFHT